MGSASQTTTKRKSPLREAQRELTRGRIRESAKRIFYDRHYASTTMDEIAAGANLSRATLYLHYKDKQEILADIIRDYAPRAIDVLSGLPGPGPSLQEVSGWIRTVADFVAHELVPLSIVEDVRHVFPEGVGQLVNLLIAAMGANNPVFVQAAEPDAPAMLRAKAFLLLTELTHACRWSCESPDRAMADALVEITAQEFVRFLSEPEAFS